MKKIILIFILILICFLITGCVSVNTSAKSTTDYGMGMIIMPDGSIIKGKCSNFSRISGNWAIITIDGITYATNDWRIVRWK